VNTCCNLVLAFCLRLSKQVPLVLFVLASTTLTLAGGELGSSPDQRFSATANDQIEITDRETRASLALGPVDGGQNVQVWFADQSDKVLSSVTHKDGFALFGAQLQDRGLAKIAVPDPGADLYNLIEKKLGIKVDARCTDPSCYKVGGEKLLDVTWDGEQAKGEGKATVKEEWSLFQNTGEDVKTFLFSVTYSFEKNRIKISDIEPVN
jgi:hypothetical protein